MVHEWIGVLPAFGERALSMSPVCTESGLDASFGSPTAESDSGESAKYRQLTSRRKCALASGSLASTRQVE
jgi:hypothetical protein